MHKNIWLSEEQIGDLLLEGFFKPLLDEVGTGRLVRECQIGRGRVDFLVLAPKTVSLYELKITACLDSVAQLIRYERDLDEYLRLHFYKGAIENARKLPKVRLCLMARYFDTKIVELCAQYGIELHRINLLSKSEFEIEYEEPECFPEVSSASQIKKELELFYEVSNG